MRITRDQNKIGVSGRQTNQVLERFCREFVNFCAFTNQDRNICIFAARFLTRLVVIFVLNQNILISSKVTLRVFLYYHIHGFTGLFFLRILPTFLKDFSLIALKFLNPKKMPAMPLRKFLLVHFPPKKKKNPKNPLKFRWCFFQSECHQVHA